MALNQFLKVPLNMRKNEKGEQEIFIYVDGQEVIVSEEEIQQGRIMRKK